MTVDYLESILARKRREVARLRSEAARWEEQARDRGPARPWGASLRREGEVALIAEFKRRAPSAGPLGGDLDAGRVAAEYASAGAAALSVLTDEDFDGDLEDLGDARRRVELPVLRKDFLLDPVQVWESRVARADAVLLIARLLGRGGLEEMYGAVAAAGMEALVEVHDERELEWALDVDAEVIGINNRDLGTFETDLEVTYGLVGSVPGDRILVAESGITAPGDVRALGAVGVDAVLVGTALISEDRPGVLAERLTGQPKSSR